VRDGHIRPSRVRPSDDTLESKPRAARLRAMSPKFASPLLGYNNNVRHKGRVFHIQTEDSGIRYGHVITHLFMDGGRILKSVKTSYAEHSDKDEMPEIVRDLMRQQHRAMAIALRQGTFDGLVEGNASASQETLALSAGVSTIPPAPPRPTTPAEPPLAAPVLAHGSPLEAESASNPPARTSSMPTIGPPTERSRYGQVDPAVLDVDRLERAAAIVSGQPAAQAAQAESAALSPPPSMVREKSAKGTYRVAPPTPVNAAGRAAATTRPASSFGQARPQGQSIFGEDLMSDKSLDEVILSYLAAELDGEKK
jgi:hypothetical protein